MSKLTREEFRVLRTRAEHDLAQSREVPSILICAGTGCIAGGAMKIYDNFKSECEARGLKVYLDMEIQYVGEGHPWWTQSLGKPDAPFADFLLWKDKPGGEAEPFLDRPRWEGYDGRWHTRRREQRVPFVNFSALDACLCQRGHVRQQR